MSDATLFEAYARLNALKSNVPEYYQVHEKWVVEFHSILDLLQATTGHELSNFRVPTSEVHPMVVSVQMASMGRPGRTNYSRDNHCERSFLVMKIDGVLNYFTYQSAPQERKIGFRVP